LTFGRLPSQPSKFSLSVYFCYVPTVVYRYIFFMGAYCFLFPCSICFYVVSSSVDNLSSSLGSISSALAMPVSRERHGKLVDNFSHEPNVTSLQDPFTSRPYQTPFYFYYCVPRKIRRCILFQIHVEYSPSSRLLVSALAVYATAFRPMFPWRANNFEKSESLLRVYVCVGFQLNSDQAFRLLDWKGHVRARGSTL